MLATWPGAQLAVQVAVELAFPNCPRYVHRMQMIEASPYVPCQDRAVPVPEWKKRAPFHDALPQDDPARGGGR